MAALLRSLFSSPPTAAGRRRQAWLILIVGLALGAAALGLALRSDDGAAPPGALAAAAGIFPVASLFDIDNVGAQPDAGGRAPDFAIHLPDGARTTLSAYRGQPVLLNFWATWCPPCRDEMPSLVQAYAQYQDQGLVIIEMNSGEGHDLVASFVQDFGMTMPVVIDPQHAIELAYQTQSLPSSFFIDRKGVVQVRWVGYMSPEVLNTSLQKIF